MSRIHDHRIRQAHQLFFHGAYQAAHAACGKICPAHGFPEKGISRNQETALLKIIAAASLCMSGSCDQLTGHLGKMDLFSVPAVMIRCHLIGSSGLGGKIQSGIFADFLFPLIGIDLCTA